MDRLLKLLAAAFFCVAASITPAKAYEPAPGGQNGGNICAGYSTVLGCALAVGYADPRLYYNTPDSPFYNASSPYNPSQCTGGSDDTAGYQWASYYTRLPVMDPTNRNAFGGSGGNIACQWTSPFTMQNNNVSIFHFPQTPVYNDTLDYESLHLDSFDLSENGMVSTTVSTTSGQNTATVGTCTGVFAGNDIYSTNIPGGDTVTSCVGTTLTFGPSNATATASGTSFWVLQTVTGPMNCHFNMHGHSSASFDYMNYRGNGTGGFLPAPYGGSTFLCNDTNQGGLNLPYVNMDHSSVRQVGNVFGPSINISTGQPTGTLGNNLLELRVSWSIFTSDGYVVAPGNTADPMFDNNQIVTNCSGIAFFCNGKITNNRVEFGNQGAQCYGHQYDYGAFRVGEPNGCGGSFNLIANNEFQNNGGPAIELVGSRSQPGAGQTLISNNAFSYDASDNNAPHDAEIEVNNASGFVNNGVTATGNVFLNNFSAHNPATSPHYLVRFNGTGDDNFSFMGNVMGPTAYSVAAYLFSTETPAHFKSMGNSGENDFQIGTKIAYGKVTAPNSSFDLGSEPDELIVPNIATASIPSCTNTITGGFYYDTTLKQFMGCQGSSPAWGVLGGGGSTVSVTAASPNITINPSPGTGTFTVGASNPTNPQTGTSYAILGSDMGKTVTGNNAAAQAYTIPVAGSPGFEANKSFSLCAIGAGTITLTPASGTVQGASNQAVTTHQCANLTSDGVSNYYGFVAR